MLGPSDEIVVSQYCFAIYPLVAMMMGAKVNAVPGRSDDTKEIPEHLAYLRDVQQYDRARAALRPYALLTYDQPGHAG